VLKKLIDRLSGRFGPVRDGDPAEDGDASAAPAEGGKSETPSDSQASSELHKATELGETLRRVFVRKLTGLREEFVVVSKESDVVAFLERLENSNEHLVRQPPLAAQRVLSTCQQPTAGLKELTDLIERDPAITQDLLQHANSAFYASGGGKIGSLHAAVQRVGMAGVESVMMRRMVEGLMSRPGEPFDRMVGKLWPHLVRTAPIARSLARAFAVDPERAFTLALLHDVGKLVLFDHIAALRTSLRRAPLLPPVFISAALRSLHETLGGIAASGWGLDDDSVIAISVHHRQPPPQANIPLSEVIYLAERIDITQQTGEDLTLAKIWREGQLSGSLDEATDHLAAMHLS